MICNVAGSYLFLDILKTLPKVNTDHVIEGRKFIYRNPPVITLCARKKSRLGIHAQTHAQSPFKPEFISAEEYRAL